MFRIIYTPANYKIKTNLLTEIYFTCLAGIGIYILYKIMEKSK